MKIYLSRLEKNAFSFGLGACVAIGCIVLVTFLPDPTCNVAYIKLQGDLATYPYEYGGIIQKSSQPHTTARANKADAPVVTDSYGSSVTASEDITAAIRTAADTSSTKAIVLEIDSPGGSPVAGEEIANALQKSGKPTVALIRDMGDSAAYMAATGANTIVASQFSGVGDIGITSSYTDQSQQDVDSGLTFNQLSIGEFKDFGNTDKPLTDEERTRELTQLQQYYDEFVAIVAKNRHLSIDTTTTLANGASMTAHDAKTAGLIDMIGDYATVKDFLSKKLGTDAKFCTVN